MGDRADREARVGADRPRHHGPVGDEQPFAAEHLTVGPDPALVLGVADPAAAERMGAGASAREQVLAQAAVPGIASELVRERARTALDEAEVPIRSAVRI